MRRDLRDILFLVGAVHRLRRQQQVEDRDGGWHEWASNIGGVLFVSGLVILPVPLIAAFVRVLRRQFTNPL